MYFPSFVIHFPDPVDLICMVNGTADNAQTCGCTSCRLDLGEDEEGDDDSHQCVGQWHGTVQAEQHCSSHDQHGEQMQAHFLGNVVGREQTLDVQVAFPVVFQGIPHPLIPFPGQVEGFDHTHSLDLFQYRVYQSCFGFLPVGSYLCRSAFHSGGDTQIQDRSRQSKEPDPPVKEKYTQDEDQRVNEPAQHTDQYHRSHSLHYIQYCCCNAGYLAQAFIIKVPHRDTLQFVTDLDPPVRHHEISGVGLLQLSETVDGGTACDTDQKERQSGPCGLIRMVSSGKSKHYIIDSPHLKHMEYCVEKSPENGFADVFLFFSGKMPDLF